MVKTEALLEKLFENTKSIFLVTDEKFNIRYISSSVEASFGLQAYSVVGRNAFDFVSQDNHEAWKQCLAEANCNMSSEISFITPSGKELYFDATITNHVSHSEIRGLVVIMHDITDKKQKHRHLEKTNHHLDQFMYKTFHDLRAPIHSALGLIELTNRSEAQDKERYFSLIKSNLQKMDSFIEEVSNYYKNEKLGVVTQRIDFDEIFRQEKELLQNLPGADQINFGYEFKGSSVLYSDPLRIKTILTNVLSNSIKYSDASKPDRFVHISVAVNDKLCRITVKDNGLGIKEEHLDKIFDIFYRGHLQVPGTGLGLYIVKDTIGRLQGGIEVSSRYGDGATFEITIPNAAVVQA